jgi:hypothetical protein
LEKSSLKRSFIDDFEVSLSLALSRNHAIETNLNHRWAQMGADGKTFREWKTGTQIGDPSSIGLNRIGGCFYPCSFVKGADHRPVVELDCSGLQTNLKPKHKWRAGNQNLITGRQFDGNWLDIGVQNCDSLLLNLVIRHSEAK